MTLPNKTKGFTIIEVVLVLAIAGLIFLVVFLALPALQRGQRDTQRKQDLGKFMSQVTSYQSNNQGVLPGNPTAGNWDAGFKTAYLTVNSTPFADPSNGSTYTVTQKASTSGANLASGLPNPATTSTSNIWVYPGVTCTNVAAGTGTVDATSRTFAAIIPQEQGVYTCQNN